jgi:hypothetical protein
MARGNPHTVLKLTAAMALVLATAIDAHAEETPGDQPVEALATPLPPKPFPRPAALGPLVLQRPNRPPPTAVVPAPAFQIKLGISGEEKATDNALTTPGATRADLITSVTPSVGVSYKTGKLDLSLNYDLGYDHYAFTKELDGFRHNGLGVADAELIEHVFFVDSRFSVTEQNVNPTGPATADNRTTSTNRTRVTTFSTTPRLEQRLGRWAIGQISYRHDETHYDTPSATIAAQNSLNATQNGVPSANLSDSRADTGKLEVRSGEEFSRLLWDYSSEASRQLQGGQTLKQNTHDIGAEYRIERNIGVLAEVGHDDIHGNQVDSGALSGIFYSAGLHWTPSPDTDLRVGWGKRNGSDNLYVLGEHKFSPMTVLRLSSKTNITTDAMAAIEALNAVQRDPNGTYIDPFSGRAANPSASSFTRSNAVYRQTVNSVVLSHTDDRETISITGSMAEQTVVGGLAPGQTTLPGTTQGTASTTVSLGLEWRHELSPVTSITLTGSEDDVIESNSPTGKMQRYRAGLGLTYQINALLTTNIAYRFIDWEPEIGARTRENMLLFGLKKIF